MTLSLCTSNPAYDSEDAENLRSAIEWAKRELGDELQRRGVLTEIVYPLAWMGRNPLAAGELAAAALNLGQADLANFRRWDITAWANQYIRQVRPAIALTATAAD
jgi:hypothetical protein